MGLPPSEFDSVFLRRPTARSTVRTDLVVVFVPVLDELSGVRDGLEPVWIQALVPKTPIAVLDEGVLRRLALIARDQ